MLDAVKGAALLRGVRGKPGVDRASLAEILLRVSALLSDHPEIAELDLNPVLALPAGIPAQAVDVRIRLQRS
jgi:acyl-CoA synthetase (NDP forming)